MVCENCGSEHNGSYGSGRFCCEKCARGFSTKEKREEINEKVSKKLSGKDIYIPKEKFCLCCGKATKKGAYLYCSFTCQHLYNNLIFINKWKLGINSGIVGKDGTNKQIKKYFLKKYNNSCQKCGWGEINIHTGNVPLALHHIDGNYKNNNEDNLQLLCPNCHSLTETYKSHNKNGRKQRAKYSA